MKAPVVIEREISALAARHRTLVSHEQLLSHGFTRKAIARQRQAGRLHVVFRGIYTYGCGTLPPFAVEEAALMACGSESFLSHRTAAALWGLSGDLPPEPDVSVKDDGCRARKGLRLHRVTGLDPAELRTKHGLPVSSPARVLLELAGTVSSDELEYPFDEAIARPLVTVAEVEQVLARHSGGRGTARLRALIEQSRDEGFTRSWGERRLRTLLRKAGIPQPETNVRIGSYRPDFAWRTERLIVEFDGYDTHGTRRMFESDRSRDAALAALGWLVIRFTWRQLRYQPELILFRLGQVMSLRARAG